MLCPSKPNSRRRGGGWEWDGRGAHGASERRMYAAVVKTSMIGPTCLVHSFLRAAGKWPHPSVRLLCKKLQKRTVSLLRSNKATRMKVKVGPGQVLSVETHYE